MTETLPELFLPLAKVYAVLIPVCILAEYFLDKEKREKLYRYFNIFYKWLDSLEIPNVHRKLSMQLDKIFDSGNLKAKSRLSIILWSICFSFTLTTISLIIGYSIETRSEWFSNIDVFIENGTIPLYFIIGVALNAIFDLPSIFVTRQIIRRMTTTKSYLFPVYIIFDLVAALCLSVLLSTVTFYTSIIIIPDEATQLPNLFDSIGFNFNTIISFLSFDKEIVLTYPNSDIWLPYVYIVFSVTTLVPTLMFLMIMVLLLILRFMFLPILKSFPMFYIKKATEETANGEKIDIFKFKPFHLIGIVIGAFWALSVAVHKAII